MHKFRGLKLDAGKRIFLSLIAGSIVAGFIPSAAASVIPMESHLLPPGIAASLERWPGGKEHLDQSRSAIAASSGSWGTGFASGDLNGDGTDDVLRLIHYSSGNRYWTSVQMLDGETGSPIFESPTRVEGVAFATAVDLGALGPGLFYFTDGIAGDWQENEIGAIDGAGEVVWRRVWKGDHPCADNDAPGDLLDRADGAPLVVGTGSLRAFDLVRRPGRETRLVVAVMDSTKRADVSCLELSRIEGSSGENIETGRWQLPGFYDVDLQILPDLTGDGRAAVVTHIFARDYEAVTLEIRSGLDQDPDFSIEAKKDHYRVVGAAKVMSSHRRQLLVQHSRPYRLAVFDGRSGRLMWRQPGELALILDDLHGDGRRDLLFTHLEDPNSSDLRYRARRVDALTGKIWSKSLRLNKEVKFQPWSYGVSSAWGDADGDGASEIRVDLGIYSDAGDQWWLRANRQHLLDGRTGRTFVKGWGLFPILGSLDNGGTDAIRIGQRTEHLIIRGVDGLTGSGLWRNRVEVASRKRFGPTHWNVSALRREGKSDHVFMAVIRKKGAGDELMTLDGASGKLLWRAGI